MIEDVSRHRDTLKEIQGINCKSLTVFYAVLVGRAPELHRIRGVEYALSAEIAHIPVLIVGYEVRRRFLIYVNTLVSYHRHSASCRHYRAKDYGEDKCREHKCRYEYYKYFLPALELYSFKLFHRFFHPYSFLRHSSALWQEPYVLHPRPTSVYM